MSPKKCSGHFGRTPPGKTLMNMVGFSVGFVVFPTCQVRVVRLLDFIGAVLG